ncbi:hypothetical protein MBLNU457_6777t1 [Dothideomycetes sp. NU457]
MDYELMRTPEMRPWAYDSILAVFDFCLSVFFREIYAPGAWRIPHEGPIILAGGPHSNQFVDSAMLMRLAKRYAKRRVSFLIAEKSMRDPYVGTLAANCGALPVVRAQDTVKPAPGEIFLPHPESDPTLVHGRGTDFTDTKLFMKGGELYLPRVGKETPEQQTIAEIIGPTEIRLRAPFKKFERDHPHFEGLRTGVKFKIAPYVDQKQMFNAVYERLDVGGCVGIFPEGGSHDRPSFLPLKAGVAIMALGALARSPDCGLKIIPCGMNYFTPNKFRSRAVMEVGPPVEVSRDQVEAFKAGGKPKRDAINSLLETIQESLDSVTQQAPDRETLMLSQATRRLYKPMRMKLPLPDVIELNRRLLKGFEKYKDRPAVKELKQAVQKYDRQLKALGVKDYQVEWGNVHRRSWWLVLFTLLYRVGELIVLSLGTLPSVALFWPVFVTARVISRDKQRKALAGSTVKLDGRDVVGSWKILVAMGFAPALYSWYTFVVTTWLYYNRHDGYYSNVLPWWLNATTYVPPYVPLTIFGVFFFFLMVGVSFAGLRIGEIGADILKSLPPLVAALNPSSASAFAKLRTQRSELVAQVKETIDAFGPELFEAFEYQRSMDDEEQSDEDTSTNKASYKSKLKSMPSSEPESPVRSRSQSRNGAGMGLGGGGLKPLTAGFSNAELGEVDRRIGEHNLRERRKKVSSD